MYDVRSFQEKLKISYEIYKDTVEEGYRVLPYTEWLEMQYFNLINKPAEERLG